MDSAEKQVTEPAQDQGLELEAFSVGFGSRRLLEDCDARFPSGTLTALLGRNGSGKSTMLRALSGLGAYSGRVLVDGCDASSLSPRCHAHSIAFVGTGRLRVPALTCRVVVSLGRTPYTGWTGRLSHSDRIKVAQAMEAVGVQHLAERNVDTLSDGEFQRVMIARALAQDTKVIILDEPTSFLDLPNRHELCSLLASLAHTMNRCVLFSTHELDIALSLADRIALIDTPRLIVGKTDAMAAGGHIERVFGLRRPLPPSLWNDG